MAVKKLWGKYAGLLAMLIFPVLGAMYAWVNKPGDVVYSLVTDLDRMTPFIKYFALPYSIWIFYIYACLVYFYMKSKRIYFLALTSYVVSALISYGIYSVFQTTVPRPVIEGDGVFDRLVKFIYNRDEPYNCFPSIHVFSSYLMMKTLYKSSFRNFWNQLLIYGMSTTIIFSTLLIKQHVILDVISALLLVEIVYWTLKRTGLAIFPSLGRQPIPAYEAKS